MRPAPRISSRRSAAAAVAAGAALALAPGPHADAAAQSGAAGDDGRAPRSFVAEIVAVADAATLRLADGRMLHLPHVVAPDPERGAAWADAGRAARRATAETALESRVHVDLGQPAYDRYGRLRGRARLPGGDDLALRLVRDGVVRVFPEIGADPERRRALLAAEADARQSDRGFWGRGLYRVAEAAELTGPYDRLRIVAGEVAGIGRARGRRFVQFGPDWRTDFTVGVDAAMARRLKQAGRPLEGLVGRRVRARGWVRVWNGPYMELADPGRLEPLPPAGPGTAGEGASGAGGGG